MSKILIWNKNLPLKNIGGPSGYLYNIYSYLEKTPNSQISFYSEVLKVSENDSCEQGLKSKLKRCGIRFPSFIRKIKCLHNHLTRRLKLTPQEITLLEKYEYVHFHTFIEARAYIEDIRKVVPHIKVILTTHTPEPYCDEYCNTVGISWIFNIPRLREKCINKETQCIDDVDYIMLPVPQVKEVYTTKSPLFEQAFLRAENKTFYVPTAIINSVETKFENYLGKFELGDSLRVCYVGRHCAVKGYNFLKDIATSAFEKKIDVTFIIGGKQDGISKLANDKWIELGWVDTNNLLQEIDVFILPNQQTYYDLILLEVIRSGKPVLLTSTGGNKYFHKFTDTGLFFCDYGDVDQACKILTELLIAKKKKVLSLYGEKNKKLFEQTSTLPIYIETYLCEVNKLK